MTHPRTWVVHFWTGQDGVLALALDNPTRREGGRELPDGSFFPSCVGSLRRCILE